MPQTLRFSSPTINYRLLGADTPHVAIVEGWTVKELFTPDTRMRGTESYGSYSVAIEREVHDFDEFNGVMPSGIGLVESIDLMWAYAAGIPLGHCGFSVQLIALAPPKNWNSNAEEIGPLIQKETCRITGKFGVEFVHHRAGDHFPLRSVLMALHAYSTTDSITRAIVELHHAGLMSSTPNGPAVMFCKALEIIRETLPGKNDQAKENALPADVKSAISHKFSWFFNMANNRWNTRHPIGKDPLTLKPPMSTDESIAFLREGDAIIRGIVCQRLGIEFASICYDRSRNGKASVNSSSPAPTEA